MRRSTPDDSRVTGARIVGAHTRGDAMDRRSAIAGNAVDWQPVGYVLTDTQAECLGAVLAIEFRWALSDVVDGRYRTVEDVFADVLARALRDPALAQCFGPATDHALVASTASPYLHAVAAALDWRELVEDIIEQRTRGR